MISFASPLWLPGGGITLVVLIVLYRNMQNRRQQELQRFAASHLLGKLCSNVSSRRRLIKKVFILVALAMCFTALARPQYGFKWIDVKRKGIDILFAVDTSKSMLAEDVRPNRLKRAKFAILDFIGQLEGDRVGLLPFAGSAFLMCPMTIDYNAFESSLEALDTTIIPRGGTDLADAIKEAEEVLSNEANHKIMVLITDGENLVGDTLNAAQTAAEKGMTIYTVGVGTSEGELIPLNRNGKAGFAKDDQGNFITSRLDETALTKIAEITGGLYVPLGASGEGLQTIYQEKLSLIPKEELAEKRHKVPLERFIWPLGAAIVLLMIEFLVGGRKSTRSLRIPFIKTAGRRKKQAAALLLCAFLVSPLQQAEASPGEEAYGTGDFLTASLFYDEKLQESPQDARLHFNYGTAAYKNNMFEDAAKAFSTALKSDDLTLQEESYYNLGNALFQRGNETQQTDAQHAIKLWEQAASSFDGALQLNSNNDDAAYNLAFVKQKIEELKKQQEEQEQQDNKDKKEDNKDNKEQEQDKGQEGDQGDQGEQDQQENKEGGEEQSESDDKSKDQQQGQDQDQEQDAGQKDEEEPAQDDDTAPGDAEEEQQQQSEEQEASEVQEAQEAQEEEDRARDQARRLQGKMTSEEAEQLLNSLMDEEGELNFVPSGKATKVNGQKKSKDW